MNLVSIIIPNYNHGEYLSRRIDSVFNQTFNNFEVILLDDASTDNSHDILSEYIRHPKVSHVIFNDRNSGSPFVQWQKGFDLAKGDYIWIAESDDWCEPTLLENLIEPLIEDPSIVLSYCQSLLVTDKGEIKWKTENRNLNETIAGRDFVVSRMFGDTVLVNAGMTLFRREVLKKIGQEYLGMKSAGDWMFWVSVALTGNVHISGKYLNYCFRHSATVSLKAETSGSDIKEGNQIFKYVLEHANPDFEDIISAINHRIDTYLFQKNSYPDKKIKAEAKKQILTIHPLSKKIYRNKIIKKYLKGLWNKLTRII
jgi:glycosyltransferase involved in cell wall biosynthesis